MRWCLVFVLAGLACTQGSPAQSLSDPDPQAIAPAPVGNADFVKQLDPPPPSCTANVRFEPTDASTLSTVRRAVVEISATGVQEPGGFELEWQTPTGVVFQRSAQQLVGSPFDQHQLEVDLPVAGTLIDSSGLAGSWKVHCYLNGAKLAQASFELTQ